MHLDLLVCQGQCFLALWSVHFRRTVSQLPGLFSRSAHELLQNDLPQSLVACPDHLSARFIFGGLEQIANRSRKIGSYTDAAQTMAVQELEGWVPLRSS